MNTARSKNVRGGHSRPSQIALEKGTAIWEGSLDPYWLAPSLEGRAQAAFTFTFNERGPDVVAIGIGSLDLADLFQIAEDNLPASGVSAQDGLAGVAGTVKVFAGIAGPLSFGAGGHVVASSSGGDAVAINGLKGFLGVPLDYVSGSPLWNSMGFDGLTFASLGLTPGTYTWSWGSGVTADSLTVQIRAAAIPETSTGAGARSRAARSHRFALPPGQIRTSGRPQLRRHKPRGA